MAGIRIGNRTAVAGNALLAAARNPEPVAPTVDRRYAAGLRTGTIVQFRRARHPQVVHQAMVVFNSDGYNAKGSKGGNRSFVSLNDDGTTIWEQGVDTIPGTFSVLGRIGTVEVIPA